MNSPRCAGPGEARHDLVPCRNEVLKRAVRVREGSLDHRNECLLMLRRGGVEDLVGHGQGGLDPDPLPEPTATFLTSSTVDPSCVPDLQHHSELAHPSDGTQAIAKHLVITHVAVVARWGIAL